VIYTAGRRDTRVVAGFDQYPRTIRYNGVTITSPDPVFAIDGGNLSMVVGGTVKAVIPSGQGQLFTDWLQREGDVDDLGVFAPHTDSQLGPLSGQQSAWWVAHSAFQHGVGALGGGNVSITAGGDIIDLTVAQPTNGRVLGGRTAVEAKTLMMTNGGSMLVSAAGSISGGQYYNGRGDAAISAGELTTGRVLTVTYYKGGSVVTENYALAPILALGDTTMSVKAKGDIVLQTVVDPLLIPLPLRSAYYPDPIDYGSYMSGYTNRTALDVVSVGGDIVVGKQINYLSRSFDDSPYPSYDPDQQSPFVPQIGRSGNADLYPAKTIFSSLSGSFTNERRILTMPVADQGMDTVDAELRILAANNVNPGIIVMAQNRPGIFPAPQRPLASNTMENFQLEYLIQGYDSNYRLNPWTPRLDNPDTLIQAKDYAPSRIYALDGSVTGGRVTANEQLWIRAGRDIRNNSLFLRNVHATDVSWLDAGNDIISGTVVSYNSSISNYLGRNVPGEIIVEGPGALLLTAGRDVYGQEFFIYSTGNRTYDVNNRPVEGLLPIKGLPETGAAIEVMAGLNGRPPAYDAFAAAYLDPANVAAMPTYLKTTINGQVVPLYSTDAYDTNRDDKQIRFGLVSFVEAMTGKARLTPDQAWQAFISLPELTRQSFLRQIYMQELRAAGRDQLDTRETGGYNRGYSAIALLFPGDAWKGNIQIGNALFRTMSGGDIKLMTPGGGVQIAALSTEVKEAYGVITLGNGRIDIFADDNVIVNQSRVLTFAGGDEIIWSTTGDIDAGRGAKTKRVPSAPEIVMDADGVNRVLEKADISGSGIGTIVGFAGVEPGDIDLIAPRGTVNAGDAGIRVSGDFTVAAQFVLNVDNIQVSGQTKGVPKATESVAPLAVETKDKGASDAVKDVTQQSAQSDRPSIIIVEVLGYGGGSGDAPAREDDEQRRRDNRRTYNTNSPYQVLGLGPLTEGQVSSLAAEQRSRRER
jgi:hypothetical protein